jgi:hypothetical protein
MGGADVSIAHVTAYNTSGYDMKQGYDFDRQAHHQNIDQYGKYPSPNA